MSDNQHYIVFDGEPEVITDPIDFDSGSYPETPAPDNGNGNDSDTGGNGSESDGNGSSNNGHYGTNGNSNEQEYLKVPMPTEQQLRDFYNANKPLVWSTGAFILLVVLLK